MSHDAHATRQVRSAVAKPPTGSQTVVQQINPDETPSATLRLRGVGPSERRHIQWAENVVDNEGLGKKSSKVCCIYHKPHEPGDSDTDSSSSSSSSENDSDGDPDLSRAQKAGGGRRKAKTEKDDGHGHGKEKARAASPNAYERQPKHTKSFKG